MPGHMQLRLAAEPLHKSNGREAIKAKRIMPLAVMSCELQTAMVEDYALQRLEHSYYCDKKSPSAD